MINSKSKLKMSNQCQIIKVLKFIHFDFGFDLLFDSFNF